MDARFFAIPDESEHMAVLASEKKIYRLRIFISVILLLIIAVFLTGVVIALILWGRRYSHIKNREYMITDGIITEKTLVSRVRIIGIKRLATVSYKGGAEKVRLTHLQGLSLGVGENVALIAVTAGMCSFHVCKM